MKKHIVFAIVITFALVACTGSKKITSTTTGSDTAMTSENQSTNSERRATAQTERTASSTENENVNENENEMTILENTNGTSGAMTNMRTTSNSGNSAFDYDGMYDELEMTDDQISSFRSAMEDFQEKQVNMPNGDMLGSIENERTRQLENILSEEQFIKYQRWEAENN